MFNPINSTISSTVSSTNDSGKSLPPKPRNDVAPGKPFASKQADPLSGLSRLNLDQNAKKAFSSHEKSTQFIAKAKLEGPRGGINSEQLNAQTDKLKRLELMRTPLSTNVTIYRAGEYVDHAKGYEFTDFAVATRQHLTEMAQTRAGEKLLNALSTHKNGRPIKHQTMIQDAGSEPGIRESAQALSNRAVMRLIPAGERFHLAAGAGASTVVSHHTDIAQRWGGKEQHASVPPIYQTAKESDGGIGMSAAIGLGHELIHAAHNMAGRNVPGETKTGMPNEEVSTVAGMKGVIGQSVDMPTENDLRQDMNTDVFNGAGFIKSIEPRTFYSGKKL